MKLNEILGIEYPFIQGGMANIATGEFAAALSVSYTHLDVYKRQSSGHAYTTGTTYDAKITANADTGNIALIEAESSGAENSGSENSETENSESE